MAGAEAAGAAWSAAGAEVAGVVWANAGIEKAAATMAARISLRIEMVSWNSAGHDGPALRIFCPIGRLCAERKRGFFDPPSCNSARGRIDRHAPVRHPDRLYFPEPRNPAAWPLPPA